MRILNDDAIKSLLSEDRAVELERLLKLVATQRPTAFEELGFSHRKQPWDSRDDAFKTGSTRNIVEDIFDDANELGDCELLGESGRDTWNPRATHVRSKPIGLRRQNTDNHVKPVDTEQRELQSIMNCATIIQFSTQIYYCYENEGQMTLDVLRMGYLEDESKVRWKTISGSAVAGVEFVGAEGWITFAPQENEKKIDITLNHDGTWSPTLEFQVELLADGIEGAVLGRYLFKARVKIMDIDAFPTNTFRSSVHDPEIMPNIGLIFQYFRLNMQQPSIRIATYRWMLINILHSFYLLMWIYVMNIMLIDQTLGDQSGLTMRERQFSLLACVVLLCVPFVVLHYADFWKNDKARIAGPALRLLVGGIFTKYLNYDESSRLRVNQADMIMAMTRDAMELVRIGYLNFVVLVRALLALFMILLFQIYLTWRAVEQNEFNLIITIVTFSPLVIFPVVMGVFMAFRMDITTRFLTLEDKYWVETLGHVDTISTNFSLIRDYNLRPKAIDRINEIFTCYADARVEASLIMTNNAYLPKWIMRLCTSSFILIAGTILIRQMQEERRTMTIGIFIANLEIFRDIGSQWSDIYETILAMATVVPGLKRITLFMNLPIDVGQRLALNRKRREMTAKFRASNVLQAQAKEAGTIPLDTMNIIINSPQPAFDEKGEKRIAELRGARGRLSISDMGACGEHGRISEYSGANRVTEAMATMMKLCDKQKGEGALHGNVSVHQGQMIVLIGPAGEGKSTLLKLIAGAILPTVCQEHCSLFVPSHLRLVHVATEALFLPVTLYENLVLGVVPGTKDGDMDRVLYILEELGVSEHIRTLVKSQENLPWISVLSQSQRHLLHLARVLIANPEIVCVHKPTLFYDERISVNVMKCLNEYVVKKGLGLDPNAWNMRRPRTVIMTTSKILTVESSGTIIHVSAKNGMREVQHEDITLGMLG
jgi:ABC-type multidrug transport system fused ATPase/permease subunit